MRILDKNTKKVNISNHTAETHTIICQYLCQNQLNVSQFGQRKVVAMHIHRKLYRSFSGLTRIMMCILQRFIIRSKIRHHNHYSE